MGLEAILGCKIWLGKERLEEVNAFKYLGTILCKWEHRRRDKGESSKGQTGDGYTGESYEVKKCKHGGKKGNKE